MTSRGAGRLDWISPSGRIVLAARGLRAFAQGFLAVLIALFLAGKGIDLPSLGLFLSAGVLGGAGYAASLHALVARIGRRRTLIALTGLSSVFSFALLFTDDLGWLMLFAALGSLASVGGAGGAGPTQPLEQAILADACDAHRRAGLFALYRFSATLAAALGALAAGLPVWLERGAGIERQLGEQAMIVAFSLCLVGVAALYARLGPEIEVEVDRPGASPLRSGLLGLRSRRIIVGLNALFGIDQLGSSLTTASLMAYWFHTRFQLDLDALAGLTFATQMLSALSMWLSARLAGRIGYVRTMVFTHVPASLMLVALAGVTDTTLAIALWLGRGLLSQMDIPARDALTMSVVEPEERVAMASLQLVGRNTLGTVGPTLSTALWQAVGAGAPLVLGGLLKVGYDVSLYILYRDIERGRRTDSS